ncbi:hypothetical protein FHETE_9008 [Fusarium heterosporum]|uniref:Uncharacterized protein n=1 Tax=Fusarium heterosporum TaxID=42747 RepID=A0A8H5WHR6_FUSHE|nr:hypothetical protein FHETE_9008 [Fusarium heterosporum]
MFPPNELRSVPPAWKTNHGSTFKSVGFGDRDNIESGVKTETVWETLNPYTTSTRDSTSTTIPISSSTEVITRPNITTESNTDNSITTPGGSQSPNSLVSTPSHSRGLSDGAIAAVVIGVIFGLVFIALAIWLLVRTRLGRPTISNPILPRQIPDYDHLPPNSPLPAPPLLSELSAHPDRISTPEDSWVSYGDRVRSPTPQPAVAEMKSFTRAWQKPRVYTVGGGRIAELQGSQPWPSLNEEDGNMRFSTLSSRTALNREREDGQGRAF